MRLPPRYPPIWPAFALIAFGVGLAAVPHLAACSGAPTSPAEEARTARAGEAACVLVFRVLEPKAGDEGICATAAELSAAALEVVRRLQQTRAAEPSPEDVQRGLYDACAAARDGGAP